MNILTLCPAPPGSRKGNRITAERWAGILRRLGHRVRIGVRPSGAERDADVLVAMHARHNAAALVWWRRRRGGAPAVLALTGTDLYGDIRTSAAARRSLQLADRLIVLQELGVLELPRALRTKARVIVQSARPLRHPPLRPRRFVKVCVLGHLRSVKDPFRTALAVQALGRRMEQRLRVVHAGAALSAAMRRRALALNRRLANYRWIGQVSGARSRQLLAGSHVMVISSKAEGGANVVCEALALGVPILASRIPGNIGLLGADYPGYFEVGDTTGLARLLERVACDAPFYRQLRAACRRKRALVHPQRELRAWRALLAELA